MESNKKRTIILLDKILNSLVLKIKKSLILLLYSLLNFNKNIKGNKIFKRKVDNLSKLKKSDLGGTSVVNECTIPPLALPALITIFWIT